MNTPTKTLAIALGGAIVLLAVVAQVTTSALLQTRAIPGARYAVQQTSITVEPGKPFTVEVDYDPAVHTALEKISVVQGSATYVLVRNAPQTGLFQLVAPAALVPGVPATLVLEGTRRGLILPGTRTDVPLIVRRPLVASPSPSPGTPAEGLIDAPRPQTSTTGVEEDEE